MTARACPTCRSPMRRVRFDDPEIGRVRALVCLPCSDVRPFPPAYRRNQK